jgi:hypothetical protein
MNNIKECIQYLLESEEVHYIEDASEYYFILQDDQDITEQVLDIHWIKKNIETINHIYMRARLAEEELE